MYHQKSTLLFGAKQTAAGVKAALNATSALAVMDVKFDPVYEIQKDKYTGDVNDRSALLTEKDRHGKIDFTTVLPVLDGEDTLAVAPWLEACGIVKDTSVEDQITFSNSSLVHSMLTTQFRRSGKVGVAEKIYEITDTVFQLGIETGVGTRTQMKFNGMGEFTRSVGGSVLVPDYTTQKTAVAPTQALGNHNSKWGTTDVCVENWSTSNYFGVETERLLLSCQSGFEISGVESEFTLTVAERPVNIGFDPESYIGKSNSFQFTLGTVAGRTVVFTLTDLIVESWSPTTVGNYAAQQIKAVSVGSASITFK